MVKQHKHLHVILQIPINHVSYELIPMSMLTCVTLEEMIVFLFCTQIIFLLFFFTIYFKEIFYYYY